MDERITYLGKRLTLLLGVLAIGLALGFHLSLDIAQNAAAAAGAWPSPYETTDPMSYPLYAAAVQLRALTNVTVGIGAVLLLGYGLADYSERTSIDIDEWLEEQGDD